MHVAHTTEPQEIIYVLLVQESQKPPDRNDPEEVVVPVNDRDVRVMALNGPEGHGLCILIGLYFDRRCSSKRRETRGPICHENAFNGHLPCEATLGVHKIDVTEFRPGSQPKRRQGFRYGVLLGRARHFRRHKVGGSRHQLAWSTMAS
jgi:hypothetical protein